MNLIERLVAVDKKEFDKIERKELSSRQLSKLLGTDVKVTIQAELHASPQPLHPGQGAGAPFREPVAVEFKAHRRRAGLGQ